MKVGEADDLITMFTSYKGDNGGVQSELMTVRQSNNTNRGGGCVTNE